LRKYSFCIASSLFPFEPLLHFALDRGTEEDAINDAYLEVVDGLVFRCGNGLLNVRVAGRKKGHDKCPKRGPSLKIELYF
jgi:hypothetical protein